MEAAPTPKRDVIIGAIILAVSSSKLTNIVGMDALRTVLSGQYRDLVEGGVLRLPHVWDLLADQPGFDADAARAPMAVLHSWEKDLGLSVELPAPMRDATATELMAWASHCPVNKAQRKQLFAAQPAPTRATGRQTKTPGFTPKAKKQKAQKRRPGLELVLAVVGVLGLAFGGFSLLRSMSTGEFEEASLPLQDLPATSQKKLGDQLSVTVGADWLAKSEEERESDLRKTMEGLDKHDIAVLVVQDEKGAVRASAQWFGSPRKLAIRFE
jgi:hypothetical protein